MCENQYFALTFDVVLVINVAIMPVTFCWYSKQIYPEDLIYINSYQNFLVFRTGSSDAKGNKHIEHEPLESGTGGDTILEESGVDASMLDEAKDEEPVVTPAIPIPAQGTLWFSP